MAAIKPIEGSSVHQIQSGQVIVDLCSVVKELIENALDASSTSLEVRFKNNGLDSIEIVDNGSGIAPEDFDNIALKHYTSKLNKYDDLTSLTTFGFRGEALSSLCALSKLSVVTSRQQDAPKGTRLEFEISGKVKARTVVAAQRGTTVTVEDIFRNLPVRRRELEKNIKREYGKVLGLLHAYACISTGVRFSVSNVPSKGKKIVVFSTKSNPTTRENIANVYGAKTLLALTPLDLTLEMHPTTVSAHTAKSSVPQADTDAKEVHLKGHISRPVVGEGRQTPDRQMFFVNSRPCALPQVSKAINEVYKSYNITQSPFIFANLELDTNAYDVNVSPDKRTILLHDQTALLEALKASLTELFESQDQSVPHAATPNLKKMPSFKQLTVNRLPPSASEDAEESDEESDSQVDVDVAPAVSSLIRRNAEGDLETRENATKSAMAALAAKRRQAMQDPTEDSGLGDTLVPEEGIHEGQMPDAPAERQNKPKIPRPVQDFNARMGVELPTQETVYPSNSSEDTDGDDEAEHSQQSRATTPEAKIPSVSNTPQKGVPGVVPNAFDRMRPRRMSPNVATVTIGNQTTSMTLGTPEAKRRRIHTPKVTSKSNKASPSFMSSLKMFSAPGTSVDNDESEEEEAETIPHTRSLAKSNAPTTDTSTSSTAASTDASDSEVSDIDEEPAQEPPDLASLVTSDNSSDDEYADESDKKAKEDERIAKIIEAAEEQAARPTSDNVKRATNVLRGRIRKDSTLQLMQQLETSVDRVEHGLEQLRRTIDQYTTDRQRANNADDEDALQSAEERLSLTVSKSDFNRMRIIGQFNLGFILAIRPSPASHGQPTSDEKDASKDELFIIDQHASDEKFNFERLQSQTIVQSQRLVHPKQLDLTAIEEEIILNHGAALEKNGFQISVDTSGDAPVGQRCKLTSLPMSREVTFSLSDLEELLALLAEHPESTTVDAPRPSKVRRMFAMRACRSSIMVGKTLTHNQMQKVVKHMGELDKPWNCPHGRPTMRHLFSMDGFGGWQEGDGLVGVEGAEVEDDMDWAQYVKDQEEVGLLNRENLDEQNDGEGEEDDPVE